MMSVYSLLVTGRSEIPSHPFLTHYTDSKKNLSPLQTLCQQLQKTSPAPNIPPPSPEPTVQSILTKHALKALDTGLELLLVAGTIYAAQKLGLGELYTPQTADW
jgi:hypothetical protein